MLFAFDGWAFAMFVLHRRGVSVAWPYARARLALASCGALASLSAYGIALWAMTQAPVAVIAALRETSVLFAALLGTWFLNEALSMRRVLATLMILMGVSALRLA
jgi:drug/metabolite transporter (DMT)-like permease